MTERLEVAYVPTRCNCRLHLPTSIKSVPAHTRLQSPACTACTCTPTSNQCLHIPTCNAWATPCTAPNTACTTPNTTCTTCTESAPPALLPILLLILRVPPVPNPHRGRYRICNESCSESGTKSMPTNN